MTNAPMEPLGERLTAYLDGELSAEEARAVEQLLHDDPDAHRMYEELRRTASLVAGLPKHRAPQAVADVVQARLERSELLGDVAPADPVATGGRASLWGMFSMAAVLTLLIGGVWYMAGSASRDGDMTKLAMAPDVTENEVRVAAPADTGAANGELGVEVLRKSRSRRRAAAKPKANRARQALTKPDERLAQADFQQKLASGMPRSAIRTHQFRNEAVVLQVPVDSEQERDALADRIVAYFTRLDTTDLGKTGAAAESVDDVGASFMYRGKPSVNFADAFDQQIIVRATRAQLSGLMEEVNTATKAAQDVTLVAGPVRIQGLRRAQTALWASASPAPKNDAEAYQHTGDDTAGLSARTGVAPTAPELKQTVIPDADPFRELLIAMGIDPDILADATETGAVDAVKTEPTRSNVALANRETELDLPTATQIRHDKQDGRNLVAGDRGSGKDLVEKQNVSSPDELTVAASRRNKLSPPVSEKRLNVQRRLADTLREQSKSTLTEPTPLVTKRRRALSTGERRAGAEPKNRMPNELTDSNRTRGARRRGRAQRAQADENAGELVTLVVQVQLTPAARARAAGAGKAIRKAKARRPTPRKNPNVDKHPS